MFKGGENKKMKSSKVKDKTQKLYILQIRCKVSHQCNIFSSVKVGFRAKVSEAQFTKMAKQYWEVV